MGRPAELSEHVAVVRRPHQYRFELSNVQYTRLAAAEYVVATAATQFQSAAASIRSIDGASRPVMASAVLAGESPGAVT
jgi:hypothetical protein